MKATAGAPVDTPYMGRILWTDLTRGEERLSVAFNPNAADRCARCASSLSEWSSTPLGITNTPAAVKALRCARRGPQFVMMNFLDYKR